jgi:hypothetical protein
MKITSDVNKHLSGFWLHDTLRRKDHFYLRSTNPKAMAPRAVVEYVKSPQTIVAPGNVIPFSGPDMNDSIFLFPNPQWLIPYSLEFSSNARSWLQIMGLQRVNVGL